MIEWDELPEEVTQVTPRHGLPALLKERLQHLDVRALAKKVAIGAGALGALLLARWGVHRLRHA